MTLGRSKAAKLRNASTKPYVGIKHGDHKREIFRASNGPTQELYGSLYVAVIGPFKTMRGAKFMRDFGANNPHCQHVDDAERIAAEQEYKGKSAKVRIHCDQCQMLSINGVACHETGCPNSRSRWDVASGEWIKQRKCFDCGCIVDADDPCCSAPIEDEEDGPATFGEKRRLGQ